MQGVRIAIPAGLILAIGEGPVKGLLESMPVWLTDGLAIGGGMVVAVGYAMVINMMATKKYGHSLQLVLFCNCFRNHSYRSRGNRCCFSSYLLGTF